MVVANLLIDPADIYLLKGDSVQYRILQVHHGRLTEIPLPSNQYFLEVEDTKIATIDENTAVVTGLSKGKTKLLLHDRNVDEKEAGIRIPTATLTVSDPCYLTIAVLPHRNRILIVEDHYEIIVEIFDKEDHKFYIGEDVVTSVSIPEKFFHVESSTANNTHHHVWPLEVGSVVISAALEGVMHNGKLEPYTRISALMEVLIYNRITIHPCEVTLPWDPYIQPKYEVALNASGGDGSFIWSSGNNSVASVMQNGLLKTLMRGQTQITAAMTRNPHNRASINVFVLPASHLEIVEYVLEVELGVPLYLHVAVFAEKPDLEGQETSTKARIPYFHCNDLPLIVKVWNNNFENSSLKITPVGIACTTVAIVGTEIGTSKVSVSYKIQEYTMSADALVATYRPLTVTHPESSLTVLAVGTSREVVFAGGPRPWIGRSSEHEHHITLEGDEHIVEVIELENSSDLPDIYIYRVLCRELGEVDVILHVANLPSVRHCKKSESMATVKIICGSPRYISLTTELNVPDPANCPMNLNSEKLVTQNYRDVELLVKVKDCQGYEFDNITSLYINWKLSHPSLATVQEQGAVIAESVLEDGINLPYKNYQILKPKGKTGVLEVTASVVGYQNPLLILMDIVPEDPPFAITNENAQKVTPEIFASLSLIFVNDTIITPNRTSVFNHPKNKLQLQVNQGSGYYDFVLSTEMVADVNYVDNTRVLEVIPKLDGILKLGLKDLCLESKPAYAEIEVLGIGSIKLDLPDKVEKGQCVTAVVRLYDTLDNLLPIPNAEFLNLKPIPESGIIGVKAQPLDKKVEIPLGEIWFVVTGLELGDTSLKFTAVQQKGDVSSTSMPIQVFPPLKLMPRNVTVIVGSSFQISSRGGPQPDANIEYSVDATDIASVGKSGVVLGASHGSTKVTGKAVGTLKSTGQRVAFSHDEVEVHVIPLKGIKIHAPLTRLKAGAMMPVWAEGMPDMLTPLVIGALQPPLKFKWSVSSMEVGVVKHVYSDYELHLGEEDMVSMRFTAASPGRTFIRLEVNVPASVTGSEDTTFHDVLEIEVFQGILLVQPPHPLVQQSPVILMAPNSEVQLRTNRDGLAQQVTYSLGGTMFPYDNTSMEFSNTRALTESEDFLTVEPNGLVRSHGRKGRAVIMVIAQEPFGIKQILSVCVMVRGVHYIMLSAQKKVRIIDEETLEIAPRGFELEFVVSYHNRAGEKFTSTTSNIRLRTNRFDYAQVRSGRGSQSLLANLMVKGDTMLKVWDDMTPTQCADYVKLTAGEVIYPDEVKLKLGSALLTVGDVICFTMPLTDLDGEHGVWETNNDNVLTLDGSIGVGKIRAPGKVVVKYQLSSGFTFSELEALPVNSIMFLETSVKALVNHDQMAPFRAPIVLVNSQAPNKIGNLITRNGSCPYDYELSSFPFMCELRFDSPIADIDVEDVFAVYQDFNMKEGTYGCVIISSGIPTLNKSLLNTNFSLHVYSGNVLSKPLKIPFIPAVFVHSRHLNLSDAKMGAFLIVSARSDILKQVKVEPYNTEFLTVGPAERLEANKMYFLVKLTDKYWTEADLTTPMNVHVVSEMTFQRVMVSVQVRLEGHSSWGQGPSSLSPESSHMQSLHGLMESSLRSRMEPVYGDPQLYMPSPEMRNLSRRRVY
ncbi:hypothetical protein C0J52_06709 [Blattella germanica]|nr:hypothetical protein C0J52_06709 [Blattella germanica]